MGIDFIVRRDFVRVLSGIISEFESPPLLAAAAPAAAAAAVAAAAAAAITVQAAGQTDH